MTIQQSFDLAVQHHQTGRLGEAQSLYRHILAHDPCHADALHLLGVVALQSGQSRAAVDLIGQAIALRSGEPQYHNNLGNAWMSLGDLGAASASFQTALTLRPPYAEAHYNLGLVLEKQGLFPAAMAEYRAAVDLQPDYPDAWLNLGTLSMKERHLEGAAIAFREVLRFRPADPQLHYKLGNALLDQGRFEEAAAAFRAAIELRPDDVDAHYSLGVALHGQEEFAAAERAYATALRFKPDHAPAQGNLGKALLDQDRVEAAIEAFHATLRLVPSHAETHFNLGNAWLRQGRHEAAAQSYRDALRYDPRFPEAWTNLGNLLQESEQVEEAMAAYRQALEIRPNDPDALKNLGGALRKQGRIAQAIQFCRRALALQPDDAHCHSNLVYHLHFDPGSDPRAIREELAAWNERHAAPLRPSIRPHANLPDPARRLKIGYVSPDFWEQAESYFVVPLFEAHDQSRYELHAYASVSRPDRVTGRLRRSVSVWHDVRRLGNEELAEKIREDGIDILIDLTMHMAHNRLLLFARKPAPIQVTWLAYPGSTGLDAIDYRLTDGLMDPPSLGAEGYAEESVRLPDSWCCYDPMSNLPQAPVETPQRGGFVRFGSLNNFCKLNELVLRLWAQVLAAVPGSRLLLLAPEGRHREDLRRTIETMDVSGDRVEFCGRCSRDEYLCLYDRIDIALDPFPYNGITTTLDALWMGVPVISLTGKTAAGRAGLSLLSTAGLPELATRTPEEFVRIAVQWAHDLPRLAELRAQLRARLQASPLMDAPRFARNIEAAYRAMWRQWCTEKDPSLP